VAASRQSLGAILVNPRGTGHEGVTTADGGDPVLCPMSSAPRRPKCGRSGSRSATTTSRRALRDQTQDFISKTNSLR